MTGMGYMVRLQERERIEIQDIIESVLKDIEYSVSFLEDSPDDVLEPFGGRLIDIGERLVRLEESLLK
jgi:hypothetical protein